MSTHGIVDHGLDQCLAKQQILAKRIADTLEIPRQYIGFMVHEQFEYTADVREMNTKMFKCQPEMISLGHLVDL